MRTSLDATGELNYAMHGRHLGITLVVVAAACAANRPGQPGLFGHCDRARADRLIAALKRRGDTLGAHGLLPPTLTQLAPARYPIGAHAEGHEGTVEYEYVVGTTGHVLPCTIRAVKATDRVFISDGADELRRATFVPAQRAGRPVAVVARQTISWSVH